MRYLVIRDAAGDVMIMLLEPDQRPRLGIGDSIIQECDSLEHAEAIAGLARRGEL